MMRGEEVTRIRTAASAATDVYGNPIPGADVEIVIPGAAFDPGGSVEPVEIGRASVVTTPKLYFRDSVPDVISTDRLRVRGVTYSVVGKPAIWVNLFTSIAAGMVVELLAVEG